MNDANIKLIKERNAERLKKRTINQADGVMGDLSGRSPTAIDDVEILLGLLQSIEEKCNGRPIAFFELLEERSRELSGDYPFPEKPTAFEYLWAISSSLEGVTKACDDWYKSAKKAIDIAVQDGQVDGDHHKMWVIDQMVRALTGCPMVTVNAVDCNGKPYQYEDQGESEAYKNIIKEACSDGHEWDTGVAP